MKELRLSYTDVLLLKTNIDGFIRQNIELFLLQNEAKYVFAHPTKTDLTDSAFPSGVEVLWSKTQDGTPTA